MAHDIFISHSSKDKKIADAVCACLEARGIRCWVAPRDIVAGADWGSSIIDGISGAKVMVLILSSHSNVSKQVLREIERAAHRGMPVLPLRVEDVTLSKSLEYFLSSAHWLDAYKGPLKQHLENLANNTAILLEKRDAVRPLSPPRASGWRARLGLASLIASIVAIFSIFFISFVAPVSPLLAIGLGVYVFAGPLLAIGLGVSGLLQRDSKKTSAIVGTIVGTTLSAVLFWGLRVSLIGVGDDGAAPTPVGVFAEPSGTITNSLGMKLVPIQAGEFLMGSPANESLNAADEEFQHPVRISKPFLLGMHEVTQRQYEQVTGENPSQFKSDELPVEHLSWKEAYRFCEMLSSLPAELQAGRRYRLPTEAEWEYACRAGTKTPFNTGDSLEPDQARFALTNRWAPKQTAPVGSYPPNSWGLFDMHGNVWEWTADWFSADYFGESPVDDPQGPAAGTHHTLRGGSASVLGLECRSAFRGESAVDGPKNDNVNRFVARFTFYGDFGVRVVCEIADKRQ